MKIKTRLLILLVSLVLVGYGLLSSQINAAGQSGNYRIYLPILQHGIALPPADEAAQRISVPAGFSIRIFAQGLSSPRLMTLGPDGWVYAAEMGSGQIVRLPDRNSDGLADGAEVVASGLNSPHNLEWFNGAMYVAEVGRIDRLTDQNKDGIYETRQLITDNIPGAGGHGSRTLHFGPDGKLYVSAGSSCNICVEEDPRRAAIMRFNPDGSIPSDNPYANDPDVRKRAVWASGLRNSVDFLWTPDGTLWANMMGSDGLGDNTPPEVVLMPIQRGSWHGWPYCYTPKLGLNQPTQPEVADTRMTPPAGITCAQAGPALLTTQAHEAPIGMTWATGSSFPSAYRDDLFVAYHGSWNTNDPANYRDCKVERISIENGKVVGEETFASGWRTPGGLCGDPTTWGRPAGLVFGKDGALYISDDKAGRVYRVTANP